MTGSYVCPHPLSASYRQSQFLSLTLLETKCILVLVPFMLFYFVIVSSDIKYKKEEKNLTLGKACYLSPVQLRNETGFAQATALLCSTPHLLLLAPVCLLWVGKPHLTLARE